jgi:hypothetical protein
MSHVIRFVRALAASLLFAALGTHAQSFNDVLGIVPPIAPGAYPVGCSNVEQDFSRLMGGDAQAYWEGRRGRRHRLRHGPPRRSGACASS